MKLSLTNCVTNCTCINKTVSPFDLYSSVKHIGNVTQFYEPTEKDRLTLNDKINRGKIMNPGYFVFRIRYQPFVFCASIDLLVSGDPKRLINGIEMEKLLHLSK